MELVKKLGALPDFRLAPNLFVTLTKIRSCHYLHQAFRGVLEMLFLPGYLSFTTWDNYIRNQFFVGLIQRASNSVGLSTWT